jgi:hypothetical protein
MPLFVEQIDTISSSQLSMTINTKSYYSSKRRTFRYDAIENYNKENYS